MSEPLSIGAAARRLGLSVDIVRALEQTGELEVTRTPGGHRRFNPTVLDAYLGRRGSRGARVSDVPEQLRQHAETQKPATPVRRELPQLATAPKHSRVPAAKQLARTVDQIFDNARLDALKAHARSLIPYDATAGARSAVLETINSYVNASRFPASTPLWVAHQAIEAKIDAVLEPFNAEAARAASIKREEDAENAERIHEERQLHSLIERGKSHAFTETLLWDRIEAEDARAAVLDALEEEIESGWTNRDVEELVDEVLEEFDEESDD
ncbi:MAG: MerR family DNA-binding transcriptional regulator [Chthoniobacterales bacterium]|nr:MerR family DNA-binding transcriptional regulator [Gemmatimonadaceae bacterium]MBA3833120.1 MerR family DNA-binding transcriptional regulator [Chthoniobacterales bacterium]